MTRFLLFPLFLFMLFSCKKQSKEIIVFTKSPEFQFTNQYGNTISDKDVKGKVHVVEFFFTTCPAICKELNASMIQIQKEFFGRKNFAILSYTVNPEYDTPKVLLEYSKKIGVQHPNWHFLTGEKEKIYDVALTGYFVGAKKDSLAPGGFLHTSNFLLIDKEGNLVNRKDKHGNPIFYDGTDANDIQDLKKDIYTLLNQ